MTILPDRKKAIIVLLTICALATGGAFIYLGLSVPAPGRQQAAGSVLGVIRKNPADAKYLESDPAVVPAVSAEPDEIPSTNYIKETVPGDEREVAEFGTLSASKEDLDALNALLKSYPNSISVKAVSVDGGMGLSYRSTKGYDCSSTIKGPYAFYCYLQMEEGAGDPEETMTYTGAYYAEGTGSIRFRPVGTVYTLRELLYRTIWESDNIAYAMCVQRFGKEGYNAFAESLGCESLKLGGSIWPPAVTVEDLVKVWSEIYRYFETETVLSKAFYESCTPGAWNNLAGALPGDCVISHKYGWAGSYGDGAIVRTPQGDYVFSVFVNSPGTDYDRAIVNRVVSAVHKMMTDSMP